jgi:probable phosphoglycerate mutase
MNTRKPGRKQSAGIDILASVHHNFAMTFPIELWLVRHGETTANATRRVSGWTDVPLNERGEEQARSVGALLERESFDSIWSSDLKRATTTARIALCEPKIDRRLREMNFGDLENRLFEEIDQHYKKTLLEFIDFAAPGGENIEGFQTRVLDFISTLIAGRHLIFTHGGVIRVLTQSMGQDRFVGNGGVVAVNWSAGKILFVKEIESAMKTISA